MMKHSAQIDEIVGQARVDKIDQMKKSIKKQQGVSTRYKNDSELVTKLSFKICELIAKKEKPSVMENLSNYLGIFTEFACPKKKHLVQQTGLSCFTVSRRINHLSKNIEVNVKHSDVTLLN